MQLSPFSPPGTARLRKSAALFEFSDYNWIAFFQTKPLSIIYRPHPPSQAKSDRCGSSADPAKGRPADKAAPLARSAPRSPLNPSCRRRLLRTGRNQSRATRLDLEHGFRKDAERIRCLPPDSNMAPAQLGNPVWQRVYHVLCAYPISSGWDLKIFVFFLSFRRQFVIFFTSVSRADGSSSINRKNHSNNFGGVR
jgi:hypothetical protein